MGRPVSVQKRGSEILGRKRQTMKGKTGQSILLSLLHKPPKLTVRQEWRLMAAVTEEITENNTATERRREKRNDRMLLHEVDVSSSEEDSIYRAPGMDSFNNIQVT
ncbi:hypothetical protein M9H77_09688 [Catharanthus roseus]|uniref:Uncharacterized protein n=1 Tax=Catharanthus roseus TaxID=4058 RepID=A0ACC0C1S1_CATRO|nr:hypothetical protein M9H77_09688 [Catharanthus roseus]